MIEANKLKLGLFIIISFALLMTGLLLLGLMDSFKEKYEFYTVFDESVQGLEKGAAIKYKGVTIGRVTKISVFKDRYVRVDMEAEPGSISPEDMSNKSEAAKIAEYKETLKKEVAKGLRCSLEISSLATGLKFIELTHITEKKREVQFKADDKGNYVPAMKSILSGAITNFDKTLANIAKIDYEGIGIHLDEALKNLNTILADPNIKKLIAKGGTALDEVTAVAQNANKKLEALKIEELQNKALTMIDNTDRNLTKLVTNTDKHLSESIKSLNTRLSKSLDTIDATMHAIQEELKDANLSETSQVAKTTLEKASTAIDNVSKEASEAFKKARTLMTSLESMKTDISKTLQSIEGAGNSLSGLRKDFASTLKRFKVTLDSVAAFIDYLEKDPSALIRGKAEK